MRKNRLLFGIAALFLGFAVPASSAVVNPSAKIYEIAGISSNGASKYGVNYKPTSLSHFPSGLTLVEGIDGSGGGTWNTGTGKINFDFSAVEKLTGQSNILNVSGYGKIKQSRSGDRVSGHLNLEITSKDLPGASALVKVKYSDRIGLGSDFPANGFDASNGVLSLLSIGHAHFKYGKEIFGKHSKHLGTFLRTDLQFVMAAVPLPASALLLLTAFGGLGFAGMRRKAASS